MNKMKIDLKNKKILIPLIIVSIIIFVIIVYFINSYNQKKTNQLITLQKNINVPTKTQDDNLPVKQMSNKPFYFPAINKDIITFISDIKQYLQYSIATQKTNTIFDKTKEGEYFANYSPNTQKCYMYSTDPDKKITLFDFIKKTTNELNSNIDKINWINNNQIIYTYNTNKDLGPDQFELQFAISDPEVKNYQKIFLNTFESVSVDPIAFIDNTLFYSTASLNVKIYKYIQNADNPEIILDNISSYVKTHDNNLIIYQKNGDLDNIYKYNLSTGESKKIKASINPIYYVVSNNNNFIFFFEVTDKDMSLVKINLETNEIIKYSLDSSTYDLEFVQSNEPQNLMLTENNQVLFFTIYDFLYKISLP